jgi:hypothetical protein
MAEEYFRATNNELTRTNRIAPLFPGQNGLLQHDETEDFEREGLSSPMKQSYQSPEKKQQPSTETMSEAVSSSEKIRQ